jgi:tetratricopeptide (TPR) repeat protein
MQPDAPSRPAVTGQRFYARRDWLAAALTGAVAFIVYLCSLAPSVTLDDAGTLTTAAFQLGGPHTPGYSLWTISAWLWWHLIPFGNIAWRLNLFSAVTSATASGLVALLISKSGRTMGVRAGFFKVEPSRAVMEWLVLACACSAGLMLAFSPALWSRAVVTAMTGVNALVLAATLVVLYRWGFQPEQRRWLWLAAALWSLGMTSEPTLAALAVAVPAFVWLTDRKLGHGPLTVALVGLMAGIGFWILKTGSVVQADTRSMVVLLAIAAGAGYWLWALWRRGASRLDRWIPVAAGGLVIIFGLALYGFLAYLQSQFNIVFVLLALPAVFFFLDLAERDRVWLQFLLLAFLCLGLGYLFLTNPAIDQSRALATQLCFLSGSCLYVFWIGYGMLLSLGYFFTARPQLRLAAFPVAALVAVLPVVALWRNGLATEQLAHNFGYQFGYLLFEPGGDYPAMNRSAVLFGGTAHGQGVAAHMIFVESFASARTKSQDKIYPASDAFDRRDVYLVAPNSLTDEASLQHLRARYGAAGRTEIYPPELLWLPAEADVQQAYSRYLADFKARAPLPGENVTEDKAGHIRIQGAASLLAVNGLIAREIFERNKDRHPYYVECNYVFPWMYPYLEPYGLIFKLNPEPVPALVDATVARDRAYWETLSDELLNTTKFRHDAAARKVFCQLRTVQASLYAYRQMWAEAEIAFQQALQLAPDNPDATYRFAQCYVDQQRCNDALELLDAYQRRAPHEAVVQQAIAQVRQRRAELDRISNLERQHALYPDNLDTALPLARAYAAAQRLDRLDAIVKELLALPALSEREFFSLIDLNARLRRTDRTLELLGQFTKRFPDNALGWFNLALIYGARGNCAEALPALEHALAHDPKLITAAQQDRRLDYCRSLIQSLRVNPPPSSNAPATPFIRNQ